MNLAHLHLMLNHIPIVGIPVALVFLIFGIRSKNVPFQRFSLVVIFGLAAVVLPVYLTGEPAEEVVEHLPGVGESFIETHEGAAKFSLILTLLSGACAFFALWFQKNDLKRRWINLGVLAIATVAFLSLLYTANLGGQIRHTEFRSGATTPNEGASTTGSDGKGEGDKGGDDD